MLIEMLVDITIRTVVLFPEFQKARENYRWVYCQSTSKQLGLAETHYTWDYDGPTPAASPAVRYRDHDHC